MKTDLLKSLKSKARIAGDLSLPDWLALIEAWWLLFAFSLLVRWMSYERLSEIVRRTHGEVVSSPDELNTAQRLGRVVLLSSRLQFIKSTCLLRALTVTWMLSKRGIRSCLCIGASKSEAGIHAHAWVQVQGQAIGESGIPLGRFQLLASNRYSLPDNIAK